jgi:hypothetical protein
MAQDGPVMVAGHEGSGCCVVVIIMYLHLTRRMGWNHWVKELKVEEPHPAHRKAFNQTNWRLLNTAIGDV